LIDYLIKRLVAWFRHNVTKKEKETLINYLQKEGDPERNINWDLIRLVLASVANTAILLFQDVLDLEEGCRMNNPYVKINDLYLVDQLNLFLEHSNPIMKKIGVGDFDGIN
jgi:hypothetical protein